MTSSTWLKDPLAIYAENAEGGVVVRDGEIVELIGKGHPPRAPVDNMFDASAHVILPGLINTHHDFYQNLTRVFAPGLNKELFIG